MGLAALRRGQRGSFVLVGRTRGWVLLQTAKNFCGCRFGDPTPCVCGPHPEDRITLGCAQGWHFQWIRGDQTVDLDFEIKGNVFPFACMRGEAWDQENEMEDGNQV